MQLGVLKTVQAVSGFLMIISLLALAFFAGQQSIHGMAIKELDEVREQQPMLKTYTRAECEPDGEFRRCEDKLVVELEEEIVVLDDKTLGSTVLRS